MLEFKKVESNMAYSIWRAEVFGGWLVVTVDDVLITANSGEHFNGYEWRSAPAFIPDPFRQWQV